MGLKERLLSRAFGMLTLIIGSFALAGLFFAIAACCLIFLLIFTYPWYLIMNHHVLAGISLVIIVYGFTFFYPTELIED